ncbi:MAG: alpha/beta fold hydrolase [Pseudomonadota bacterium]
MTKYTADGTAYEIVGPVGAPAVILIHGLGLCRDIWRAHLPELSRSHCVILYDLYGHGESAPAPATVTLTLFSEQVLGLMEAIGLKKMSLIGFSIGGMINRRVALDHSERLDRIVILNSPHDRGAEAQKSVEARAAKVRDEGRMATMQNALERWFTPEFRLAHPEYLTKVRDWRAATDPESYAQSAWVLANGVRELITPKPVIDQPCLVITSQNDSGSTPEMSHAIAAEIPGSECHIIPKLQHLGLIEDPKAFTSPIVKFLNG